MSETRDVTKWPGTRVETPEDRARVVAEYGEEHVKTCPRCGEEFFSPKLKAETCWGCWYVGELESAERIYQDVFDAIRSMGVKAEMTQTGGMCLAISIDAGRGYYMLLTNSGDVLSWGRREDDGWMLGVYDGSNYYSDGEPLPLFGGEDYLENGTKSAETARELVKRAFVEVNRHVRSVR
jgi:hypothetical protein